VRFDVAAAPAKPDFLIVGVLVVIAAAVAAGRPSVL
jgi:hypothetical protein